MGIVEIMNDFLSSVSWKLTTYGYDAKNNKNKKKMCFINEYE